MPPQARQAKKNAPGVYRGRLCSADAIVDPRPRLTRRVVFQEACNMLSWFSSPV